MSFFSHIMVLAWPNSLLPITCTTGNYSGKFYLVLSEGVLGATLWTNWYCLSHAWKKLWKRQQSRWHFFQSLPMWLDCPQTTKSLGLAASWNCWDYIIVCWDMRWLLFHGKHIDEEACFQGLRGRVSALCLPPLYDVLGVVTSALGWLVSDFPAVGVFGCDHIRRCMTLVILWDFLIYVCGGLWCSCGSAYRRQTEQGSHAWWSDQMWVWPQTWQCLLCLGKLASLLCLHYSHVAWQINLCCSLPASISFLLLWSLSLLVYQSCIFLLDVYLLCSAEVLFSAHSYYCPTCPELAPSYSQFNMSNEKLVYCLLGLSCKQDIT